MFRYGVTTPYGIVSSSGLEDRDGWFYRINTQTDSIDRMDGITGQGWQFVNGMAYCPFTDDLYIGGNTSGSIQAPAYFGWTDSLPQPYGINGASYPYLSKYNMLPCQSPLEIASTDSLVCLNELLYFTTNHNLDYPLWSDSSSYSFLEIDESGEYWVQGWDESGCLQKDFISITDGQIITFATLPDYPGCFGENDGGLNLIFDTTQVITSFQWSNNLGTNEDISGITAGSYSVTITNADGCTRTFPFILQQPSLLNVFINSNAAQPTAIANGGTPPYSFIWQPGNIEGDILPDVSDGIYTVTVTDANGCTDEMITTIAHIDNHAFNLIAYPNPAHDVLNITTKGSRRIQLINALGQVVFESNASSSIDCSNFARGIYQLKISTAGDNQQTTIVLH
jgi:hypothetical protein